MKKKVYSVTAYVLYAAMFALLIPSRAIMDKTHWLARDSRIMSSIAPSYADSQVDIIMGEAKKLGSSGGPMGPSFPYTAQKHLEHMRQLTLLEKSVAMDWEPVNKGQYLDKPGIGGPPTPRNDSKAALRKIQNAKVELTRYFEEGSYWNSPSLKQEYEKLAAADPQLREYESFEPQVWHWDFAPLALFLGQMYLWTMLGAAMMFWAGILALEIDPSQLRGFGPRAMFALQAIFAVACWPVMFWRFPSPKGFKELARLFMRQVAMAVSFFFTVAVPNMALAQSGKADNQKKRDSEHTLIVNQSVSDAPEKPKNSFALSFEGVNKYHGMAVGEIFAPKPAPRVLARYTRLTSAGDFYVDSWNSFGLGFNMESDLGVGWARSGWNFSLTKFFIRGGDVIQFGGSKSGSVKLGKRKLPLGATLLHYFRTNGSSPPVGTILKLATGFNHSAGLGKDLRLAHRFALGTDNNPFGLGHGITMVGFYTAEAGYKGAYLGWSASVPVVGQSNTSRGFRQSVSVGYRHAFGW
ncbi:MAG: hypothetical protein KW788_01280 [Candidatus Doudnabacteria bacterium]|nr:hypothetical protein [Candidatus Doudnabacteria bacterium]